MCRGEGVCGGEEGGGESVRFGGYLFTVGLCGTELAPQPCGSTATNQPVGTHSNPFQQSVSFSCSFIHSLLNAAR